MWQEQCVGWAMVGTSSGLQQALPAGYFLRRFSEEVGIFAQVFWRSQGAARNPVDQYVLLWYNGFTPTQLVGLYQAIGDCRSGGRVLTPGCIVSNPAYMRFSELVPLFPRTANVEMGDLYPTTWRGNADDHGGQIP